VTVAHKPHFNPLERRDRLGRWTIGGGGPPRQRYLIWPEKDGRWSVRDTQNNHKRKAYFKEKDSARKRAAALNQISQAKRGQEHALQMPAPTATPAAKPKYETLPGVRHWDRRGGRGYAKYGKGLYIPSQNRVIVWGVSEQDGRPIHKNVMSRLLKRGAISKDEVAHAFNVEPDGGVEYQLPLVGYAGYEGSSERAYENPDLIKNIVASNPDFYDIWGKWEQQHVHPLQAGKGKPAKKAKRTPREMAVGRLAKAKEAVDARDYAKAKDLVDLARKYMEREQVDPELRKELLRGSGISGQQAWRTYLARIDALMGNRPAPAEFQPYSGHSVSDAKAWAESQGLSLDVGVVSQPGLAPADVVQQTAQALSDVMGRYPIMRERGAQRLAGVTNYTKLTKREAHAKALAAAFTTTAHDQAAPNGGYLMYFNNQKDMREYLDRLKLLQAGGDLVAGDHHGVMVHELGHITAFIGLSKGKLDMRKGRAGAYDTEARFMAPDMLANLLVEQNIYKAMDDSNITWEDRMAISNYATQPGGHEFFAEVFALKNTRGFDSLPPKLKAKLERFCSSCNATAGQVVI
jgi:hypothetical protein